MISSEVLKQQVSSLPDKPGVYQYFNVNEEIIYVGKAKNLKKRVSSYFNKIHDSGKTNVLVKNIASLKYIVVDTEEDALLLENNLIKVHQPRYNVLLKDGKTYPSICITNELFPRIFKTRNIIKNGSRYFGPRITSYNVCYTKLLRCCRPGIFACVGRTQFPIDRTEPFWFVAQCG